MVEATACGTSVTGAWEVDLPLFPKNKGARGDGRLCRPCSIHFELVGARDRNFDDLPTFAVFDCADFWLLHLDNLLYLRLFFHIFDA